MKTRLLRCLGWLSLKIDWFLSLFFAKEVFYLLVTMGVLFFAGMLCSKCNWPLAFCYLFDAGQASKHIWTMVIFFATWLVGGGVLVSVMVAQYYKNMGGYFRRWPALVRNHVVVLGWDNGMMMEVKQAMDEGKGSACYVITRQDVFALAKSFRSAGLKHVMIYKGEYDNEREWRKYLQVGRAQRVFVAGEVDEEAHDARVRLLYDKLCYDVPKERIKVNIHDFGLAKKLIAKEKTVFENFHQKWADALWRRLDLPRELKDWDLFVVGFGAMGKAIVLSIPKSVAANVTIHVSDDDVKKLKEELDRYNAQFGSITPLSGEKWKSTLETIKSSVANGKECVVVVAKKRSEKGLACMMDVIAQFRDHIPHNLQLALSQEIDGFDTPSDAAQMLISPADVVLFGMKKGCCNGTQS